MLVIIIGSYAGSNPSDDHIELRTVPPFSFLAPVPPSFGGGRGSFFLGACPMADSGMINTWKDE